MKVWVIETIAWRDRLPGLRGGGGDAGRAEARLVGEDAARHAEADRLRHRRAGEAAAGGGAAEGAAEDLGQRRRDLRRR